MSSRRRGLMVLLVVCGLLLLLPASSASARPSVSFPGLDCTEAPTLDMPGDGIAAFFDRTPTPLPRQEDPFKPDAATTIYQQYGYSGLRWHTYDLGCGPDAARNPDAVIGTAVSNWTMNIPVSMSALTASVTDAAFHPSFLDLFDPLVTHISSALHRSLFATWVPAVIALLGIAVIFMARRAALATTAAAVGWALMVVLIATALFRWPLAAGHVADATVTSTVGSTVSGIDGRHTKVPPSVAIASNVQESIFYQSWLAGTLGSTDSATARKYGPRLFKDQALTWHEAYVVRHDSTAGKKIIENKQDDWKTAASEIQGSDPTSYEYLTGKRSDTRVGYALLSCLAALLALPFLLVSAFLLLGSFLIVRLAVMLFPAIAVLGVFPATRGLVIGLGRTVGAALVNAIIFGIGAAITIRVLGLILDPHSKLPGWLSLVLLPLFGFVMWMALKPFRRLTSMVSPRANPFGDAAGAVGNASRDGGKWLKKAGATAVGVWGGNVAAVATAGALDGDPDSDVVPERAEAKPAAEDRPAGQGIPEQRRALEAVGSQRHPGGKDPGSMSGSPRASSPSTQRPTPRYQNVDSEDDVPLPAPSEAEPLPPVEPEWVDGEEVYTLYRPDDASSNDAA